MTSESIVWDQVIKDMEKDDKYDEPTEKIIIERDRVDKDEAI